MSSTEGSGARLRRVDRREALAIPTVLGTGIRIASERVQERRKELRDDDGPERFTATWNRS
jgi:hypothetical protein